MNDSSAIGNSNAPAPSGNEERHPPQDPPSLPDQTVISQRPVAGPEDFYHSLPFLEMARHLIGKQLDHFVLDELVGGGGMGAVFRGRDLRLDRVVAVKVIPNARRDSETQRRFRVEAQSAAKLDHPNIARVYYVGESDPWSYIVFEFIEGINLRDLVSQRGPLSVDDSVYFIKQIAEALEHARSREVVHRDIKPSNILITSEGRAKLVDMGLARTNEIEKSSQDVTASGVTLGTFDYISPEQARDPRDADVRSDLYSLGCTWYYLLLARPPFPEGTALQKLLRHGSEKPEDPRYLRSDLSSDLVAILYKLMAKRPSDRYQQPMELVGDLQLLAQLEDLPKSQMMGTMIVPPTVTQRTFTEMAMPWFLALAMLLLSTYWLQSMDRWQGNYPLPMSTADRSGMPPLVETNGSEPASNRSDSDSDPSAIPLKPSDLANRGIPSDAPRSQLNPPFANDAKHDLPKQGTSDNRILHVSTEPNSIKAESGSVFRSIEEAIAEAERHANIEEIWIATSQLNCGSIKINRSGLTIRSAPGFRPKIQWNVESSKGTERPSVWFDVGSNDFALRGIALDAAIPNEYGKWTVFRMEASSKLEVTDASVTVVNYSRTSDCTMIACEGNARRNFDPIEAFSVPAPSSLAPLQIRMENAIFRGEAKWLTMEDAYRTEIRWKNGLLAVSGHMLDLGGSSIPSRTPVNIRLMLERVTLACNRSLARINMDAQHPYRVSLARDSIDSAYWIPRGQPLVELNGLEELEDAEEMIDFRGEDNAYDEGIETIAVATTKDGQQRFYRFDEAPMNVLRERGIESAVRWSEPMPPSEPFHLQRPSDYRQREGDFQPGMEENQLPNGSVF